MILLTNGSAQAAPTAGYFQLHPTDNDYAIWRVIPVGTHMTLDVLNGVFIMLAPWIFGYRDLLTAGQEVLHASPARGHIESP